MTSRGDLRILLENVIDEHQRLFRLKEGIREGWPRIHMMFRIHQNVVATHVTVQDLALEDNGSMNYSRRVSMTENN